VRIDQVADENFSYWHNATFNNDGSKILFSDEWYGTKCRANDPYEWGANAIFTINEDRKLEFHSYYKMDAIQTEYEICVAHNGSLLPVPGRDIMIQSWYEGGVSLFDWTDPDNPVEIGFHDRGPMQIGNVGSGGSWSIYWYNGYLVNSEIYRGLDILDLKANPYLTQNEIDASKTVVLDYLNVQGQPKYEWPATFALAKAYVDQLDRDPAVSEEMIQDLRVGIARAETNGDMKVLQDLASKVAGNATGAHADKMGQLAETLKSLAG
jgi:bacterioferritin (cytochrome b1)